MDGHRRQAAAVALALGVVLFATALLAPSSGAKPKKVEISASCSGGDPQRCGVPQDVGSWPSGTKISISWAAAEGSCSQFQVIALVDGEEVARSPFSQSGAAIPTFTLPNDDSQHSVSLDAEGMVGGCNHGKLYLWGVEATIHTKKPPGLIRGDIIDSDGVPLADGVEVTAKKASGKHKRTLRARTNVEGQFEIEVPSKALGTYVVQPHGKRLHFHPKRRRVKVRAGRRSRALFRADEHCDETGKPARRVMQRGADAPLDGLYIDESAGITLNYSCRSKEVVVRVEVPGESRRCISGWGVQFPQGPGSGWVFSPRLGIYGGKNALFTSGQRGSPGSFSGRFLGRKRAYVKWHYDGGSPDCQYSRESHQIRHVKGSAVDWASPP